MVYFIPSTSGIVIETDHGPPVIGDDGLKRNLGAKAGVDKHFGYLKEDDDGFYLASLSTEKNIRRVRKGDNIRLPIMGRDGTYIREYYVFG